MKPIFHRFYKTLYHLRFVGRAPINNQEDHSRHVMKQSLDKFDKLGCSYPALDRHEPELSLCANRRDEVQPKPRSGAAHHRRFAFHGPGGSSMVVRTHTRLIPKEDQSLLLPGQTANPWILLLQPFLNFFRSLLVRSPHGTLGRQSQLHQQATNRGLTQLHFEFPVNHLPDHFCRPKGKREFELQGVLLGDGFVNPSYRLGIKFWLATASIFGVKSGPDL